MAFLSRIGIHAGTVLAGPPEPIRPHFIPSSHGPPAKIEMDLPSSYFQQDSNTLSGIAVGAYPFHKYEVKLRSCCGAVLRLNLTED